MAEYNAKLHVKTNTGYDDINLKTKSEVVEFNNDMTNLESTNVEDAIKEINEKNDNLEKSLSTVAKTGNYNDLTNKPELGDAASRDVANNLTTNEEGKLLDATQGKILNDKISSLESILEVKESYITTNSSEITNVKQNNVMMSGRVIRLKLVFSLIKNNNDYHKVTIGTIPEDYRPRTEEIFYYSDSLGTLLTFSIMSDGEIIMYPSTTYRENISVILTGVYI